jgi:hypothetical protein
VELGEKLVETGEVGRFIVAELVQRGVAGDALPDFETLQIRVAVGAHYSSGSLVS